MVMESSHHNKEKCICEASVTTSGDINAGSNGSAHKGHDSIPNELTLRKFRVLRRQLRCFILFTPTASAQLLTAKEVKHISSFPGFTFRQVFSTIILLMFRIVVVLYKNSNA